jgi:hypothetical protein
MRMVEDDPPPKAERSIRQRVHVTLPGYSKPILADLVMVADDEHRMSIKEIIAANPDELPPGSQTIWRVKDFNEYRQVHDRLGRMLLGKSPATGSLDPPSVAEFLAAAIIPKNRRDAILGDLDERFARDCSEFGAKRARLRYWGYVISSAVPLLWSRTKKIRALAYLAATRKILGV